MRKYLLLPVQVMIRSNQYNVIQAVDQCDLMWTNKVIIISADYITAESRRGDIVLRLHQVKANGSGGPCKLVQEKKHFQINSYIPSARDS